MSLSKFYFVLILILLTQSVNAQKKNNKAVDVVESAISAMGGKEFIKSIHTLYCNSTTQMDGRDVNWITKEMLPNKGSFEIIYQERVVYKSWFDGELGYEINNGEKKIADQEEFKNKSFKKNIFNELDYLDSSLYKLEYIGVENVESKKCNKIKATLANGEIKYLYYDEKSFFLLKEETVKNGEKNSFSTVLYGDYKKFNKLTYCTTMRFGTDDNVQSAKIVELFYNEKVSETDFK